MVADLPTQEEFFDIAKAEVIYRNSFRDKSEQLSIEAIDTPGSIINLLLSTQAVIANEITRHLAIRWAACYIDSSEGEDLDRLVYDRFGSELVRKEASKSVGQVTFSRTIPPSDGLAGTLPMGLTVRTSTGVTFELLQSASFGQNSVGPITVQAQCTQTGTIGNVNASSITEFATTPFDTSITVANSQPMAGGSARETDAAFRTRARNYWKTLRRGTLLAIEEGAKTVDGVAEAQATEEKDLSGNPTGKVLLSISDANGQANQVLADAVVATLDEYRPAGVIVEVTPSVRLEQNIVYNITLSQGADLNTITQQLKSLTLAAVNNLKPGETLYRSLLFATARKIPNIIVSNNAVATPSSDITPLPSQTIRTTLAKVIVNGV